jgi:hypothetical protein
MPIFKLDKFSRVIEHLSDASPSISTPQIPTHNPSISHEKVKLCDGSDYLTGDSSSNCACNVDNETVHHQTGDGKVLVDMCSDGSVPKNNTGNYCLGPNSYKLVYDISNDKISYRKNAMTQIGESIPAVTRRWCS